MGVSLVVSLAVLANTRSGLYADRDPEHAVSINPLNAEARVRMLTARLAEGASANNADAVRQIAMTGSVFEPADARFLSLIGLSDEAAGNNQEAQNYYEAALEVLPIEIQALGRRFVWQVGNGDFDQAVSTAETVYRRWPQYREIITPHLLQILSDPAGYQEIVNRFANLPGGPVWLINTLSVGPETALLVNRLLLEFNQRGQGDLRPAINRLTDRLFRWGYADAAYQLFLNTLNETEKAENGYIFNGEFNLRPNGNMFDWKLRNQSGMDFSIIDLPSGTERQKALQVRFLDNPVRFNTAVMLTRLPPSRFTLTIDYATRSLRGPKPVRLVVDCINERKATELISIEFAIGGSSEQVVSAEFAIPPVNCELQRLRLVNDNYVESWNNRYSGSLLLKSVKLSRTQ